MKVKEILEILHSNSKKVSEKEIFGLLDNIGIEDATLETDIDVNVTKKLSKRYGVEFKPVKAKKESKAQAPKTEVKVVKKEEKPVEVKKEETSKQVKPVEVKKEEVKQQPKEEVKKEVKKETNQLKIKKLNKNKK